jgi:hypothetical protein
MRRSLLAAALAAVVVVPSARVLATVPPADDAAGIAIVRGQAEAAAAEFFATADEGGATHIACEVPSADSAGVTFYCYGVTTGGATLVALATINDYGTAELSAVAPGVGATSTAPTTTSPILSSAQGTGSQVVQVDPIAGPSIVAVTHNGADAFEVQPLQGGVPVGAPIVSVTGAWTGRYLTGLGGTISAFSVTADGDWTLNVERRETALAFDEATGVSGENPDVVAYNDDAASTASVTFEGAGPVVVTAVTVAGSQELANQAGPFTGDIEVPAGPGFLTVDAAGPWSLQPPAPPTTTST